MKLLIDCTQITRTKAGVGIYGLNLVAQLVAAYPATQFWLLVQNDDPEFFFNAPNVKLIKVEASLFRRMAFRFLLEQLYIPWLSFRHRLDVVHSLHYSFPMLWIRARKVVTVHDLTSIKMPEVHMKAKLRYYRFFLKAGERGADSVIFVSEATRRDYLEYYRRDPATCHVVPLGKGPEFHPGVDPNLVKKTLAKFGIVQPYILYIGTIEPRKNLARLVEAFARLKDAYPQHLLIIVGKKGWAYDDIFAAVHECGVADRVLFTGFIDEADKPVLICGAEVFAYPSLYEGFGVPVLEALACGVPTVTSNLSSLPEVAGDAALLIDPTSVEEIYRALEHILEDPALRSSLAKAALGQAAKFDWRRTAAETYTVYTGD